MPSSSDLVRLRIYLAKAPHESKGAQSNSTRSSFEGGAGSSPTSAPHQQARVRDWRDLSRFFPRKGCGRRLVLDYEIVRLKELIRLRTGQDIRAHPTWTAFVSGYGRRDVAQNLKRR